MLTSLRIRNFKAWRDTGKVRLAPLTVIFGANSAGKSSIGHLLLALKQTALATDRKRALQLGDTNTLIDLGTLSDCLFKHDNSSALEFEIAWDLPKSLTVKDLHDRRKTYSGNSLYLRSSLKADKKEQPAIQGFEYNLRDGPRGDEAKTTVLDVCHDLSSGGGWALKSEKYNFVLSPRSFIGFQKPASQGIKTLDFSQISHWQQSEC
jgi:hypothetical protein